MKKLSPIERAKKERDEQDDAVFGTVISIFVWCFLFGVIYLLFK